MNTPGELGRRLLDLHREYDAAIASDEEAMVGGSYVGGRSPEQIGVDYEKAFRELVEAS